MGEWSKRIGKGVFNTSNLPQSERILRLYKLEDRGFPLEPLNPSTENLLATLHPGENHNDGCNHDNCKIKLVCDGDFMSASDVDGGIDVHFDKVWVEIRWR